jgi:hypothetical protein
MAFLVMIIPPSVDDEATNYTFFDLYIKLKYIIYAIVPEICRTYIHCQKPVKQESKP